MKNLDLTYKLFDLKIKSKAPDQIYFMSQLFQEHSHCYDRQKDKIRKSKLGKFIYFSCHSFPLRTGKFLENTFHRYTGIWTKGR